MLLALLCVQVCARGCREHSAAMWCTAWQRDSPFVGYSDSSALLTRDGPFCVLGLINELPRWSNKGTSAIDLFGLGGGRFFVTEPKRMLKVLHFLWLEGLYE